MNLLYTHWHEKSLFPQYPTQKENPSGIKVSYVIENDQEFERTQALITPLSTFYIPGETDQEITDEQHARHLITLKVVDYCHRMVYEWFELIKKTKKKSSSIFLKSPPTKDPILMIPSTPYKILYTSFLKLL